MSNNLFYCSAEGMNLTPEKIRECEAMDIKVQPYTSTIHVHVHACNMYFLHYLHVLTSYITCNCLTSTSLFEAHVQP